MSTALKRITAAEFEKLDEDGRYELIDGELVEREMGTKTVRVGGLIFDLLLQFSFRTGAGEALPDGVCYRCFSDDAERIRKPDVSWFNAPRWKPDYSDTTSIEVAPDLIVEVISPNDNAYEVTKKVDEFFRAGTREAWMVYPHTKQVERRFADGAARWYSADEEIDASPLIPGFAWRLSGVLAKA